MSLGAAPRSPQASLEIDAEACVHQLAACARCTACVDICPRQAWTQDADGLGFDAERCDGCGLCVGACPTDALSLVPPLPLPAPLGGIGTLVCERAGVPVGRAGLGAVEQVAAHITAVPCVHALGEAALIDWAARGGRVLQAVTGDCRHCPRGAQAARGLGWRGGRVGAALRARGRPALEVRRLAPGAWAAAQAAPESAVSSGAQSAAQSVQHSAATAAPAAPARRPSAPDQPDPTRRRWLSLGTRSGGLGGPAATAAAAPTRVQATATLVGWGIGPLLWSVARAPERCDACGACARLCPTQAITRPAEGLAWRLDRCTGCALCIDACTPGALQAAGPGAAVGAAAGGPGGGMAAAAAPPSASAAALHPPVVDLWPIETAACPRCGTRHERLSAPPAGPPGAGEASAVCPGCRSLRRPMRGNRIVQATRSESLAGPVADADASFRSVANAPLADPDDPFA